MAEILDSLMKPAIPALVQRRPGIKTGGGAFQACIPTFAAGIGLRFGDFVADRLDLAPRLLKRSKPGIIGGCMDRGQPHASKSEDQNSGTAWREERKESPNAVP